MSTYTRDYLEALGETLARTVTDERFLKHIEEIQDSDDPDEQYALAQKVTRDALMEEGLELPAGVRVAPRSFENPHYARRNGIQAPGQEPGSDRNQNRPESHDRASWPTGPLDGQPAQREDSETVARHLEAGISEIADFVSSDPFRLLLAEMAMTPVDSRPAFVLDVVLDEQERAERGVEVPEDIVIQRSTFHDGRPTLFCVAKVTPLAYPWRKVTVTFDNTFVEKAAS